ncbi:TPA: PTS system mannose/fructose/N-acetylgalactosamine-transporter subunit IIB [Klebsiella pneumoniae]|jgi:PTS system mannose-specific IIB component
MENLALTRIDDRLIHGQVVTAWMKYTAARKVIVIDDQVVKDEFMVSVLEMAAPKGVAIDILSGEQAIEKLKGTLTVPTIILVKGPAILNYLLDNGIPLPSVDLAGMGAKPERSVLHKNISISKDEKAEFQKLLDRGVDLYLQVMPTDKKIDMADLLSKFNK